MVDLEAKYFDLERRVQKLEAAKLSGVPNLSVADRIDTLHDRVTQVQNNVNARITKEAQSIRAEMKAGFATVNERFERIDSRFEQVDRRFEQVDTQLDGLRTLLMRIDAKLPDSQVN